MKNIVSVHNQKFWILWLVHIWAASALFWFIVGPIIEALFVGSGKSISATGLIILIAFILLPLIIIQLLTIFYFTQSDLKKTWIVILLSYPLPIGSAIIGAQKISERMQLKRAQKLIGLILFFLLILFIEYTLLQFYAVGIYSRIVDLILQNHNIVQPL